MLPQHHIKISMLTKSLQKQLSFSEDQIHENFCNWFPFTFYNVNMTNIIILCYLPSMRTWIVSRSMLSVVKRTSNEKTNVHIGSAIFHAGCWKQNNPNAQQQQNLLQQEYSTNLFFCAFISTDTKFTLIKDHNSLRYFKHQ